MSDDLATWLLAAIDEEERVARETGDDPVDSEHQARWTPDRVLAECEAKRRIVQEYIAQREFERQLPNSALQSPDETSAWEACVRILAEPYAKAGSPGYREEWRP